MSADRVFHQERDTKRIKQIHQKRDEKVCFLLPCVPFWHSTLSWRIANPYTQWVWIANQTNGTAWSPRWIVMGRKRYKNNRFLKSEFCIFFHFSKSEFCILFHFSISGYYLLVK